MVLIWFDTLPSVRIAVLLLSFYGHSKTKNPKASRVPAVGNERALVALDGI